MDSLLSRMIDAIFAYILVFMNCIAFTDKVKKELMNFRHVTSR